MGKVLSTIVVLAGISGLLGSCSGNLEYNYKGDYKIDGKEIQFDVDWLNRANSLQVRGNEEVSCYKDIDDDDGDSITVDEVQIYLREWKLLSRYSRDNKKDEEASEAPNHSKLWGF